MMFISEERLIVEKIKEYIKDKESIMYENIIMLRNGRILDIFDYRDMVSRGKINPQDAYVYIMIYRTAFRADFHYPFLYQYHYSNYSDLLNAYLSKLGFQYLYLAVPATGLKYIADAEVYGDYLSIEVVNLDIAANNTNLPKIVSEVLGGKIISGEKELTDEEYFKILDMFKSQLILAGYDFSKASRIIADYYDEGKKSLAKEVARIAMDYYDIFHPYRVCYKIRTWKEIDCWSIKF